MRRPELKPFVALSFLLLLGSAACATGSGVGAGRLYRRSDIESVRMKSIDVVVTVAAVQTSGPQLNVGAFEPPTPDEILLPPAEDEATRRELVETLRARLTGQGFEVRMIHTGAVATSAPAPGAPRMMTSTSTSSAPGTVPMGRIETSTISVAPGGPSLTIAPPRPVDNVDVPLAPGTRLSQILANSSADGVLVVRVVPVDAFYIFEEAGRSSVVDPTTGQMQVVSSDKPIPRSGRLMFGQAFLFDRQTSLRLWTKNLPDFPDSARLVPESAFLEYGIVTAVGDPELRASEKADLAATKFVQAIFSDFVSPSEGTGAGRQMLDAIDPTHEAASQAFLDEGWLGIGVGFSWTAETAGADVTIESEVVDTLGSGAVVPSGVFRATPRLSIVSPGGFAFQVAIPVGIGPGSFGRTYHRDNEDPTNLMNNADEGAKATISGPVLGGIEVAGGYLLPITHQFQLLPSAGIFGEAWFLDTSPAVGDPVHVRLGLVGRIDAVIRSSPSSPLFFRGGADVRVGLDTNGPSIFGLGLTAGVGLFL